MCCQLVPEIGIVVGPPPRTFGPAVPGGLRLHWRVGALQSEARPAVAATVLAETGRAEVAVNTR